MIVIHHNTQTGFSILEVILSVAIFTMSVVGIGLFMIDIMTTAEKSQHLTQAVLIAEEGIEAVQAIRDNDFDTIIDAVDSQTGIALNDTETAWEFTNETHDVTTLNGKDFYRSIYVDLDTTTDPSLDGASATSSLVRIRAEISWARRGGTSTTELYTYVTNWNR